jgi:uncharacterized protein
MSNSCILYALCVYILIVGYLIMEIRFETALLSMAQESSGDDSDEYKRECSGDDGDYECPDPSHLDMAFTPLVIDTNTSSRDMLTFRCVKGIYKQICSDGYYIVCNPIGTGRVAVLDEEAAELLECFRAPVSLASLQSAENIHRQARAAVEFFYKMGFLEHVAQAPVVSVQERPQTLSVWLHVTNACNLRCDYCYLDKTPESMTDDTGRKAIEAIFRSAVKHHFKKVRLRYAGGEASLQCERVIALHDYALVLAQQYRIDLRASILSNGVFLAQRTIDRLKDRNIGIMISLDGVGVSHDSQRLFANGRGSFRFVDRTIMQLLAKDLVPYITVTATQRNLAGLPELITYILERELPFSLNSYRDNDCSAHIRDLHLADEQMIIAMRSVFALIERRLPRRSLLGSLIDKADFRRPHDRTCGVGQTYLVIDQRGGIAKCHTDIKRTVTTIAADDPLSIVRNDLQGVQGYAVDEKEGCRSCFWRYWCSGGCPLLTYRATGRSDVKSPNCNVYQAIFPDVLRLEALCLLKHVAPYPLAQPDEERQRASLFYV